MSVNETNEEKESNLVEAAVFDINEVRDIILPDVLTDDDHLSAPETSQHKDLEIVLSEVATLGADVSEAQASHEGSVISSAEVIIDESRGENDDNEKRGSCEKKKRKRQPRKVADKLHETPKQRRDTFKRTSASIEMAVKDLKTKTGCEAYFKSMMDTEQKNLKYESGNDFMLHENPTSMSVEQVKTVVSEAVAMQMKPTLEVLQSIAGANQPSKSTFTSFSPKKRAVTSKGNCCYVCGQESVIRDYRTYSSTWIQCSGDGKPCLRSAHCDCLWLPGLTTEDVHKLPDMYCPEHWGYGRIQKEASVHGEDAGKSSVRRGKGKGKSFSK